MYAILLVLMNLCSVGFEWEEVDSYDADTFPEDMEWTMLGSTDMDRWIEDGWLIQHPRLCDGCPGPFGQSTSYHGLLTHFADVNEFFVEVVMETTGEADFVHTAPSVFAFANHLGSLYHFVVGRDEGRFARDALIPFVYFDLEPAMPHRYRLDLCGDLRYLLFVDDELIDEGIPECPFFPGINPSIAFAATYYGQEHITRVDYIRFGPIPIDASLDFDSDSLISWYDHFLFTDYLSGPNVPHARGWGAGDADNDSDIDLHDFAAFQNTFTGDE